MVDFWPLWPQLFRKITKFKKTFFQYYSFIAKLSITLMLMRIATHFFCYLMLDSTFINHFRIFFEILTYFIFLFSHMV